MRKHLSAASHFLSENGICNYFFTFSIAKGNCLTWIHVSFRPKKTQAEKINCMVEKYEIDGGQNIMTFAVRF